MTKMKLIMSTLGVFTVYLLFATPAQAQLFGRTYVSNSGSNASPSCGSTAPCKAISFAMTKTLAGGEVVVLDSGEFGPIGVITKSITINGDGSAATISASNGITINAGVNDVVTIRGVSINGVSGGATAIKYQSAKQVLIENCSISNVPFNLIEVALSAPGNLVVKNTTIQGLNNGSNIQNGIKQTTADNALTASLEDVRIIGTYNGLELVNGVVTISNSLVAQNSNIGILAAGGTINVESSRVASNAVAVQANFGAVIRLSNAAILNNTTGISILAGGTVATFGNNKVAGNIFSSLPNAAIGQQ